MKRQITVGMLAHVDAGKTTLTEGLLYNGGAIRTLGRVDHRDTFLDTDPIERERGITVYAKQARLTAGDTDFTLLDTPGHADLSPEMERTLWVLDYAILLISAQEGVTGQVRLLWKLLEHYRIPAFVFVNKMDRPDADAAALLAEIQKELSSSCVDFSRADLQSADFQEQIALSDEALLDALLDGRTITGADVIRVIRERKLFPVWFGAALKNEGVADLMDGMLAYMTPDEPKEGFGARVFKISRDSRGSRLAWMKITGGTLKVRQSIDYEKNGENRTEKVDQIRLYSGSGYEAVPEAPCGAVAAVTGLSGIGAGDALGGETALTSQVIEPVLTYELEYEPPLQTALVLEALRKIEEEEPRLHVRLSQKTGKISVQVMGKVQMEILKRRMSEQFGMEIGFGSQTILYKETIAKTTEGVGHFEPLRHYAEVRLRLEPLPRGSGVQFDNLCPREELEPHWQRLILSHLNEKIHTGVLTDSELTDIRISLLGGRAHIKHTVSGDFRQAAFRALRQGLMENSNILLEPYYDYTLTVPESALGRALYDLNQAGASGSPPELAEGICTVTGRGPAAFLGGYQEQVTVYSGGEGRLSCSFSGYEPCHNTEEVCRKLAYDPERDVENPADSVFCSHGAGIIVPWYQVKERMHTESSLPDMEFGEEELPDAAEGVQIRPAGKAGDEAEAHLSYQERSARLAAAEEELQEIFTRTYGAKGEPASRPGWKTARRQQELFRSSGTGRKKPKAPEHEYLLVDGYNIIFAWDDLRKMAESDIGAARDLLMDQLSDYQGMQSGTLILVFDAWKVPGGREAVSRYHNIYVVYTRESETADQYIEKTVHDLSRNNKVTVATSDGLEQIIILGEGAVRLSAAGLLEEVRQSRKQLKQEYLGDTRQGRGYALDRISQEVRDALKGLPDTEEKT